MSSGYQRPQYNPRDDYRGWRPTPMHHYDYANWGFIILYLVIILGSLLLNGFFLLVVKRNPNLHRTAHYMLSTLAIRDIIVTILVVPFVIDSQAVNLMRWRAGETLCKLYSFLNYGTLATHSFLLLFFLIFLYFWYRKQEAYMTEDGTTVVRKNKMHKWAIPLVWVIGLGLAIPAGALAFNGINGHTGTRSCSVWNGIGNNQSNYWVELTAVLVAFILPLVLVLFPVIALLMQLCGSREPRLDPPHNRMAMTAVALVAIWIGTRAPAEIYMLMKLFHQSSLGIKAYPTQGTPYAWQSFNTDIVINSLIYVACLLDPIVYFILNPDYRAGAVVVWRNLYCNKDPVQRERETEARKQRTMHQRRYPDAQTNRNRAPQHLRPGDQPLLSSTQPQIVGSGGQPGGGQYPAYPPPGSQVPMQHYPPHQLIPDQQFLDNSFERLSPQLPPVFEYDGLKYIDTARVEPKIGYSPTKTPPKTPETPHFRNKPFTIPIVANQPRWSPPPPGAEMEMMDLSPQQFNSQGPLATSEPKVSRPSSFHLETLDGSPGNTLRSRSRMGSSPNPVQDLDETVEILSESPGQKNRRKTRESQEPASTNGNGLLGSSRPTSPLDAARPGSRAGGVEIVITGRTRSRQDLCPDVPRSKFEHSV